MSKMNLLTNELLAQFQLAKGKAYSILYPPININKVINAFIKKFKDKRPEAKIIVIKNKVNIELEDSTVDVLNLSLINPYKYKYVSDFTITINCPVDKIYNLFKCTSFIYNIFTEDINNYVPSTEIKDFFTRIYSKYSHVSIQEELAVSPVEEYIVGVELSIEDKELYDKYYNTITDYLRIFGDLDTINKCRLGDSVTNESAASFRERFARQNGWNERLDMSIEYNRQIDKSYNPNVLYEYATNFYKLIPKLKKLIVDNPNKIDAIIDILEKIPTKKSVLIVNNSGEFAHEISENINEHTNFLFGEYHNDIPQSYINDSNGNVITYKSGLNKGKPKIFAAKALSTLFEQEYNRGTLKGLCIKFSSDPDLEVNYDYIIFTTPLNKNIVDFKKRFNKVYCNEEVTKLYVICTNGTKEEKEVYINKLAPIVKIMEQNNLNEKSLSFNEKNNTIILDCI